MMKSQTVKHGTVLQRIKRHRESYLLMLPYLLFFTVFTLAPVVVAFVLSFTEYNMLQPPRFVFMANYIRMFLEDNVFLTAVSNTLKIAVVIGPVSYMLCFFIDLSGSSRLIYLLTRPRQVIF